MMRAPGVLRCIALLFLCDMSLRVCGFTRTMRMARRLAGEPHAAYSTVGLDGVLHRVLVATAFYPGRSKCLEQTIAAYLLLRRRGLPVTMQFGVQPYPFYAHAWLALDGEPLTESPEVVARFALLPEPAL